MKRNPMFLLKLGVLAAILIVTLVPASCGSGTPPTSSATGKVESFSRYGNLSVKLSGLMTFKTADATAVNPAEFAVPPISIAWMGPILSGQL